MIRASFVAVLGVLGLAIVGCGGVTAEPTDGAAEHAADGPAGDAEPSVDAGTDADAATSGDADAGGTADADAKVDVGGSADADAAADVGTGGDADAGGGVAHYVVRASVTSLGADGMSSIPVFITGTDASGDPSTERVVLGLTRATAGTVMPSPVTLALVTGATSAFTPCDARTTKMCLGKVRITLALASAPMEVLAESQDINLIADGIGSPSPCLKGGNALAFDGDADNYIFKGMQLVTKGTWAGTATATQVHVKVTPTDPKQGLWWDTYFDSSKLGMPLAPGVYKDAMRWPFQTEGHPGLDVGGDGRGCNMVTGSFHIQDLVTSGTTLRSFTATFDHHCEGGSSAVRGCVHFEM